MVENLELESTYLAASIPDDLKACPHFIIEDVYFPSSNRHPRLRIRRRGDAYELTKKSRLDENDASQQQEHTIELTAEEYNALAKGSGRRVSKMRYLMEYGDKTAEIDIFRGALKGLVVVEFEFNDLKQRDSFEMPDFCLADVTQEDFIAGGMLAGKSYSDIQPKLTRFGYEAINVDSSLLK